MSVCLILTPIVIASWPTFAAAIAGAAAALGYSAIEENAGERTTHENRNLRTISLEMENSEVITESLGRDQRMTITRDGITAVFSRDSRGKPGLHVSGENYTEETLRGVGEELSRKVIQRYVYEHLLEELKGQQFVVVEEAVDGAEAIRMKVRRWEN